MSNFTFFHNVFYVICTLKSCNSHISVASCCFFEFGMVSKWWIREWVKDLDTVRLTFFSIDLSSVTYHTHDILNQLFRTVQESRYMYLPVTSNCFFFHTIFKTLMHFLSSKYTTHSSLQEIKLFQHFFPPYILP